MKKFFTLALLVALVGGPGLARATDTRLLTVDNMNQIVPDDWDATTYYSLSPHFKNHWYADQYSTGKSLGWAFVDVGIGTLVVWFNKPFEGSSLYDAATGFSPAAVAGLNATAFSTDTVNAWEPKEKRIKTPDNKVALGYAIEATDDLNFAVCFRLADLNSSKEVSDQDGNGNPGALLGASTAYQSTLGSAAYNALQTYKYGSAQGSTGMVVSPQFSYTGENSTLDFKFDMIWAGINNTHSEDLLDNGTGDKGSIDQSLKDKGRMSWYFRPKYRYMFDNSDSMVLRVSYGQLDLSTTHHVQGSFSGPGLSAQELAGYDLVDSDENLNIQQADATIGYLKTWNKGKNLLLWGFVPSAQILHLNAISYQTRGGATSYNDVVRAGQQDIVDTSWNLPLVLGTEITLAPWCKVRSVVQRSWYAYSGDKSVKDTFDSSDQRTSSIETDTATDSITGWVFNTGLGFNVGSLGWDVALNTGALAAAAGANTVNPLFQSSFTYEF
jgi:hypothetical protein